MSTDSMESDLLRLAGETKQGLQDIDQVSRRGSAPPADRMDINKMVKNNPSILGGYDFIEQPKSKPLGQIDMNGGELPPMPTASAPELIPMPTDLVSHAEAYVAPKPETPPTTTPPDYSLEGFDLFQHAIVREILNEVKSSIAILKKSLGELEAKEALIIKLMGGS